MAAKRLPNCSLCGEMRVPVGNKGRYGCPPCNSVRSCAYQKTNKEKINAYRKERRKSKGREAKLKERYNMSLDDYLILYESQNGCCAICGITKDVLHVDHRHSDGLVRGLLCGSCNRGLGLFKDNSNVILEAHNYLERFR